VPHRRPSRPARRASALAACLAAACAAAPAAQAADVHLRGTAYEFNNVRVRLAGATVGVAEHPTRRATVRADGSYDLRVPDRSRVTPFVTAAGHRTIHLQTFRTAGEDLENVNLQTPSLAIYGALAALLRVPLDAEGNLERCAIVSTFSTRNVRGVGFEDFIGYGAHGVAGATAATTPALPAPVYFNDDVIPDPAQRRSSEDGGVIWTHVPDGVYSVRASHPATRFAPFTATCRAGRIVNANPPWGLHELGLAMPARASASWRRTARGAVLRSLRVRGLPAGATVRVRCAGRGCGLRARTISPAGPVLDVARALGRRVTLRPGSRLEVAMAAPAHDTRVETWAARRGAAPRRSTACVPLGDTGRGRC
jgi:hypothetical protein